MVYLLYGLSTIALLCAGGELLPSNCLLCFLLSRLSISLPARKPPSGLIDSPVISWSGAELGALAPFACSCVWWHRCHSWRPLPSHDIRPCYQPLEK